MQPTLAHTRARTLQGRLGTQQNGSTSVRSSGRLAEELIPDQRHNVENIEGDYSDELRRLETFMNDDSVDNDYDLEMSEDDDEHAVTTPAAERLSGGEDGFQTYGREQRRSTTNTTDMLPPRSTHAMRYQFWRWQPRSSRRDKIYLSFSGLAAIPDHFKLNQR